MFILSRKQAITTHMSLFKTTYLALGLIITSALGTGHYLNAAEIEDFRSSNSIELVEVVIQIDAELPSAINSDSANDEQPSEASNKRGWKIVHSLFNIFADVTSLTGSAIFISTPTVANPLLFPISAGMAAGSSLIDAFRGFTLKLDEIKNHPGSVRSVCTIINTIGQAVSISGLLILANGSPIEVGAWLAVGGGLLKFGSGSIELGVYGIDETFGDDHTITNSIFRIGLLGVGGTVGGLMLASGISIPSPELIRIGIYTLASTGLAGNLEVLVRDVQEVQSLCSQTD
ncbi:MAG: hypothetical protein ABI041_19660 [Bdellovibrionia bacterium]